MARMNRVSPWGDLHAVAERGLFTGNRGCLVDEGGQLVRHHRGTLWITCLTQFRDWQHPLDAPHTWTPLFFLDDAVALAAGHRPCGLCRRHDYQSYRSAVTTGSGLNAPLFATDLNRSLGRERLRRGRGLERARDRILWAAPSADLPPGTVCLDPDGDDTPHLVTDHGMHPFGFGCWGPPKTLPGRVVPVLTPPTSVTALRHGFTPILHPSATG